MKDFSKRISSAFVVTLVLFLGSGLFLVLGLNFDGARTCYPLEMIFVAIAASALTFWVLHAFEIIRGIKKIGEIKAEISHLEKERDEIKTDVLNEKMLKEAHEKVFRGEGIEQDMYIAVMCSKKEELLTSQEAK